MNRRKQSGQALALAAVALVAVLGFVGLGIDMGMLRYEKRLQQTAADAIAIAEATELGNGGVNSPAATNGAQANGFSGATVVLNTACPSSVTTLTVTINNPPLSGPHQSGADSADYVEVCVTTLQPTYFMQVFGVANETVGARAVATDYSGATNGNNNYNCDIQLGPPAASIEGDNINGAATLNAPTCGIADNGNFNTKGNALTVNAGSFGVSGGPNISGPGGSVTCTSGQTNCPQYAVPAVRDPFASLTPPAVGTPVAWTGTPVPGTTYNGANINGGNINFPAGVYVFSGSSFVCHGNPNITGTGVTFYFTNGSTIQCSGTDYMNLSAPSSGPYQGVLMWQDAQDCNCGKGGCDNGVVSCGNGPQLGGTTGSQWNGALYFPNDMITFFGTNVTFSAGMVVSDALTLSGTPTLNLQGQAGIPGGLPPALFVGSATLVE